MTHTAVNRFRQLAYGQKQANWDPAMLAAAKKASPQEVKDALVQRSYAALANRAQTAPMAGLAVGGGVAVGGLSAILAALLSKKETMLRNAAIAGAGGAAVGMSGAAIYGSLVKDALAKRKRRLATGGLDKHEDLN